MLELFAHWALAFIVIGWLPWALICWLSPYLICSGRKPIQRYVMSPTLQRNFDAFGIKLYECEQLQGYAFSGYLGFQPVVVFNAVFLRYARIEARDFTAAHELGHHVMGHVGLRLACRALLIDRFKLVRLRLQYTEQEANEYAEDRTGHPPGVVWGPVAVPEAGGAGQSAEEAG